MLRSYFKIGIRNLLRHKSHSLINIAGLAAGMICCLFIVLYIADEVSYDRFHEKSERILRIAMEDWAKMPPAFAPAMKASYPHLAENAVRLWPLFAPAKLRHDDVVFVESGGMFADAAVFNVFSWPMISGNDSTALTAANSIVLTQSMAKKYFGNENALGQQLSFWGNDVTVTGIIKDIPSNTHLRFDFLVSFPTLAKIMGDHLDDEWGMPVFYTYVVARTNGSARDISRAARELAHSRGIGGQSSIVVQPIADIYLRSHLKGEAGPGGNITYLYTLATAAIIVLLLACINFVNLTTARAATRTKEVGIRKVMGAMRTQLIGQFFGEALLMSLAAFIIAVVFVNMTLPAFNHLAGKAIQPGDIAQPSIGFSLLGAMLLIGLAAGAYPALFLSRFKPASVLKGSGNLKLTNMFVRKTLIVFQFTISTTFLICIAVVILQLRYLQSKDLGFDRENVLVLDGDNFPQVRDALQDVVGVSYVAGVPQVFGRPLPLSPYKASGVYTDSLSQMRHYGVTSDFIETLGLKLMAGRSFAGRVESDEQGAFVVNEAAIREFGWNADEAIGRSFSMMVPPLEGGQEVWREGFIVGVVEDFHFDALYSPIEAVVLYPSHDMNLTLVRVNDLHAGLLTGIKNVWTKVNPDAPFNYYFLDDHLRTQYSAEEKLGRFMGAATALAIGIACLGLLALVSFSASQRTKEIGIRKVLGATVSQIVFLLSSDFLRLVCLAVVLAIPIAYIGMNRWLDHFAYHVSLSWLIFFAAACAAVIIAILSVSYQSIKAAVADPAESIRYE
jgi:putative ABC transport system permease protein